MTAKKLIFTRQPLAKRYKSSYQSKTIIDNVEKQLSKTNILSTNTINLSGQPISSVLMSNFTENINYNYNNLFSNINKLSSAIDKTNLAFGKKLEEDINDFENILLHSQLKKNNYLFNFFLKKDINLQPIQDPLTFINFSDKKIMTYIDNIGFTLPIKSSIKIPLERIFVDRSKSTIGSVIQEQFIINPEVSYSLLFQKTDKNSLGNVFERNICNVTLVLKIPGIQLINRLEFNSYSTYSIATIHYLNENEELIELDFESKSTLGKEIIAFESVLAKTIFINFSIKTPIDFNSINESLGQVFSFNFNKLECFYETYFEDAFLRSKEVKVKLLSGVKVNISSEENDYLLDTYCEISNNKKSFRFKVKNSYLDSYKVPLYFKNKTHVFPMMLDSLAVYKNETLLDPSEYRLITSLNSSVIDDLSLIDSSKQQSLQLVLNSYDSTAYYYAEIKPKLNVTNLNGLIYNVNSVMFNEKIFDATISFIFVWRKISPNNLSKIPFLKSLSFRAL